MAFVALNEQSTYYFSSSFSREILWLPGLCGLQQRQLRSLLDRGSRGLVTSNGQAAQAEYDTSLETQSHKNSGSGKQNLGRRGKLFSAATPGRVPLWMRGVLAWSRKLLPGQKDEIGNVALA